MQTAKESLSPGVLSMIPLFYVGWADSVLSPNEMKLIHKKIEKAPHLTLDEKAYLIKWTNPINPPGDDIFKTWVQAIKKYGDLVPEDSKHNLVTLGIAMARASIHYKNDELWNLPKTVDAMNDIQNALGLDWREGLSNFTDPLQIPASDHSFDIAKLKSILDHPHEEIKDRIRKLLRDPLFKIYHYESKSKYREHVKTQLIALAQQGVSRYAFPEAYGGLERKGDHIAVYEMLGYGDLSLAVKFGVQFGLFGGAIDGLGTETHHRKYIEPLMNGQLLGCFAMTETGHGSDVKKLETTASYNPDDDSITVHSPSESATKEYIGNGLHGTMAVVFAQLIVHDENHGVHAILVPIRDSENRVCEGVTIEDCGYKLGLNGVDNVKIKFDRVIVPRANLLNKFGSIEKGKYVSQIQNPNKRFFTMLGALVVGRISVGLLGINAAKSALNIAINYGSRRKQFALKEDMDETILMDYPSHQRRLIPHLAKTYAIYFSLKRLTKKFTVSDGSDIRMIETLAAGLKAYGTWHATNVIQECREACGGKGYLWENRIADLKGDSDIFTTFEGDNTVLMQLVAKGLLTEFRQSFHDEGFRAVMKYLGDRISARIKELNPYTSRNWNKSHLLDEEFHLDTFEYRERKLLITVSQRMRNYLKKRLPPHQAFLKCQNHMISLAHAFVENLILKDFYDDVRALSDSAEKSVLTKLAQVYALHTIEKHKGWYLENDYMEGVKTKAIRRIIDNLLQELRPEAKGLVDAFAIPKGMLNAEILG